MKKNGIVSHDQRGACVKDAGSVLPWSEGSGVDSQRIWRWVGSWHFAANWALAARVVLREESEVGWRGLLAPLLP